MGKRTQAEIAAEEKAVRDAKFAKEQEDLQNNFTEGMSKLKERLKNGIDTQEEFDEKVFAKEQLHLANMLGLHQRYGENTADINAQILDNELNRIKTVEQADIDSKKKQIDSVAQLGDQLINFNGS